MHGCLPVFQGHSTQTTAGHNSIVVSCCTDARESAGFIINAPSNGGRIKSCPALPEIASEPALVVCRHTAWSLRRQWHLKLLLRDACSPALPEHPMALSHLLDCRADLPFDARVVALNSRCGQGPCRNVEAQHLSDICCARCRCVQAAAAVPGRLLGH